MSLTSSLCVFLFLGAFGSVVCGKAVGLEESEADNPCVHKGKKVTIDVRKIANMFNRVNITSPRGQYIYFLSLCSPMACSFSESEPQNKTAAGCQYITSYQEFLKLGSSASYKWHLVNTTYYYIVFGGGDTKYAYVPRKMKVAFQVDNSVCERKPTIEYNGEVYPWTVNQTYEFTIHVSSDEGVISFNNDINTKL